MTKTQFFDGAKSITLDTLLSWRDSGYSWVGNTSDALTVYRAVPFLYRCIDVRANALAAMPWTIYRGETELATDDIDEMPAGLEMFSNLPEHLYRIEAALCLGSQAYLLKLMNRVRIVDLRWLEPGTMEPIWTAQGIGGFKRTLNTGQQFTLAPEEVVYLWLKGTAETTPRPAPAVAALNAAGVLSSVDTFAKAFFDRGAIKGTLLTVEGAPSKEERERLKSWWARFFGKGNATAFGAEVVSAAVKPVIVGEGISELSNAPLTSEKREDIATAMGVPHSLVLSNAANFATSEQDVENFYNQTVQPAARLIQRQLNEQVLAPMGLRLEFRPESLSVYQTDEGQRATTFATYVNAGMKPSIAAQMLDMDLPEGVEYADLDSEPMPEPQPVLLAATSQDAQGEEEQGEQERVEEEKRFLRWAKKRKQPDVAAFKSGILSDADKEALLGQSITPFEWIGPITPEWVKAMVLRLDPDDDEAERRLRDALEKRSEREIAAAFQDWQADLFAEGATVAEVQTAVTNLQAPQKVKDVLQRALIDGVDLGVSVAVDQLGNIGFDWTLAHAEARRAATTYGYELIQGIEDTTRRVMQESVGRWVENGEPLDRLVRDLEPTFGRQRARLIAQTETTRAYAMGQEEAMAESGVVDEMEWLTAEDERVCPQCGGLNGQRRPLRGSYPSGERRPPAHPGCRCDEAPVVRE